MFSCSLVSVFLFVYQLKHLRLRGILYMHFNSRQNDNGNLLDQRFDYGHAISEYLTIEGYIVGERDDTGVLFEKELRFKYRYLPALQPSVEIYTGEDFIGLGPGYGDSSIRRTETTKMGINIYCWAKLRL